MLPVLAIDLTIQTDLVEHNTVDICFIVFGSLPLGIDVNVLKETYCTYREFYDRLTCRNPASAIPVFTYTLWYPEFNLETCKYVIRASNNLQISGEVAVSGP